MPHNITRDRLNHYQETLNNLKIINPNQLAANDVYYGQIKEIVNFIRDGASSVENIKVISGARVYVPNTFSMYLGIIHTLPEAHYRPKVTIVDHFSEEKWKNVKTPMFNTVF